MVTHSLFDALTSADLYLDLCRRLNAGIDARTFRRWRRDCGVGNKPEYTHQDLDVLTVYATAMLRTRSKTYALSKVSEFLIYAPAPSESCQGSTDSTIDVDAGPV